VRTPGQDGLSMFTARTPGVPRVCDAVAALASPPAKSLVIPTVSLPVQSAEQGEHPLSGSCNMSEWRSQGRIRGGIGSSIAGRQTSAGDLDYLFT
jgi:hypothetical protein